MIASMTGYGKSVIEQNDLVIEVEVRCLNSRFLDISLKIPRILSDKELEFRNLVKEKIIRGKVSVSLYLQRNGIDNRIATLQEENLKGVLKVLNDLKLKSNIKSEITLDHLLAFQNLIFADDSGSNQAEFEIAKKAISLAMEDLNEMRKKEGKALVDDLHHRIGNIENVVAKINGINPNEVKLYFEKLKSRAKELLDELSGYDERLKMELALLAEKYDVTEECIRLKSHSDQFNSILKNEVEVGRRLNFLVQEMNREANTINSKSISSEVTRLGLVIKEELEKIREQIQNIE